MRKLFFAFALFLYATAAQAAGKPTELATLIRAQTPYGSGDYSLLLLDIYDAQLWTDAAKWSWNVPFALTINYHMDIDGSDLSEKSVEEIDNQSPLTPEQKIDYNAQLVPIFPDVKKGDEITAYYKPRHGIVFYRNGAKSGAITDPVFAKRFLSIWLSDKTSAPELREDLLALSGK